MHTSSGARAKPPVGSKPPKKAAKRAAKAAKKAAKARAAAQALPPGPPAPAPAALQAESMRLWAWLARRGSPVVYSDPEDPEVTGVGVLVDPPTGDGLPVIKRGRAVWVGEVAGEGYRLRVAHRRDLRLDLRTPVGRALAHAWRNAEVPLAVLQQLPMSQRMVLLDVGSRVRDYAAFSTDEVHAYAEAYHRITAAMEAATGVGAA